MSGRIAFLDCDAGIAGDMLVAALIHAGAPLPAVLAEVAALGVSGWSARVVPAQRGAIAASRFLVEPEGDGVGAPAAAHDHGHDHGHGHGHDHAGPPLLHLPGLDVPAAAVFPGQPARTWTAIRTLLEGAPLRPRVRARALATFGRLAEAEARVHGVPVEAVGFHEVGAVDSLVDVLAACAALEELGVDRVVATPLPMGQGRVRTEHGVLPVPVPATVEVLRGFPVVPSPWSGELVTPTGAALVAALASPGPLPAMVIEAVGYGAGSRDPADHANVVRVVIGTEGAGAPVQVLELRAQVDDLPGELLPPLLEALLGAGALDAWATPVIMKKGRPGLLVGALAQAEDRAAVGEALLRHSGSFGYRWSAAEREVLVRSWDVVATPWGEVRVKVGRREGRLLHAAPEYEDCAALARASDRGIAEVYRAALAAWRER